MLVRSGAIRSTATGAGPPGGADAAGGTGLLASLQAAGRRAGNAPAVVEAADHLSYQRLWELAAGVRIRLDRSGIPPAGRVLLTSADRGLLVASLLGTLLGGRVPVVLPSTTEPDRRGYLLAAARPDATVSDDPGWAGSAAVVLHPEGPAPGQAWQAPYPVEPDHPAYVVFTSGSTGRPKAVLLPHRSLAANIGWQVRHSGAAALMSSQYAAVGFDSFISEVLSTLAVGGQLHIVPDRLRVDAAGLLHWIAAARLTRVFLPYVALQALAAASTDDDPPLAVRQLYVAGEQLVVTARIRAFFRRHPGTRLINRYGPSETHCVVVHDLADTPDEWETRPPLGLPLPHCEIVLGPVEGGTEATILGDAVGLGYLPPDSPGADRFGRLPDGAGIVRPAYRTGDLMEVRDGLLYFVGRVDHQVKIRGVRVELEGIEAQARRVPEVLHACAVLEHAPSGAQVLRLALVPAPGAPAEVPDRVRQQLQRSFPAEVLPQSYHILPALPLTERGKVDRAGVLRAIAVFT
jgi:non-ribosomal peptide synthetase component F